MMFSDDAWTNMMPIYLWYETIFLVLLKISNNKYHFCALYCGVTDLSYDSYNSPKKKFGEKTIVIKIIIKTAFFVQLKCIQICLF